MARYRRGCPSQVLGYDAESNESSSTIGKRWGSLYQSLENDAKRNLSRASGAPPLGPLKRFTSAFSALASVGVYGAAIINACFLNEEIVSEEPAEGIEIVAQYRWVPNTAAQLDITVS
jgi:hypothetical protein